VFTRKKNAEIKTPTIRALLKSHGERKGKRDTKPLPKYRLIYHELHVVILSIELSKELSKKKIVRQFIMHSGLKQDREGKRTNHAVSFVSELKVV